MIKKFHHSISLYFMIAVSLFAVLPVNAQNAEINNIISVKDSLSLDQIMEVVIENHPTIKKAEESISQADARVGIAKSGYYPTIDASANVSNVGPVPALEVPGLGSFQLFPRNNISLGINVYQNIYDFGKTATNIDFANENKDLLEKVAGVTKDKMAIGVVQNYYALVYLQQAIKINDEQLAALNEHLNFVKKKKATGSGTDFEILSTQVKISRAESQKLDIEAARDMQLAVLNSLMGLPVKDYHVVKESLNIEHPDIPSDSLISYAVVHRKEMQIDEKQTEIAKLHLKMVKIQNNPSINFIAEGGMKNGYVPDINKVKPNYVVGLGIKVPIFDGTRSKYNEMIARSEIETSNFDRETLHRTISTEVIENETGLQKALQKVDQAKVQLMQAQKAYELARVNYSAGAITNLDLLDAETSVSESKLILLKSQIDYVVGVYQLESSLGQQLY